MPLNVTVWHGHRHEKTNATVQQIYPDGMHAVMKAAIEEQLGAEVNVRTALLDDDQHGLTDEVLDSTDVMTWWGHMAHGDVSDETAKKVADRVMGGMGLIVLHSGHFSKPFKRLMGTGCGLKWREAAEKERLWCVSPGHPLTAGMTKDYIELPHVEMYGEPFDIPTPDELVFVSWFEGGEVFRSGCTWRRGAGRVVYLRPGHETFPIYFNPEIRRLLANAVRYAAPVDGVVPHTFKAPNIKEPLSPIEASHEVDESLHKHN